MDYSIEQCWHIVCGKCRAKFSTIEGFIWHWELRHLEKKEPAKEVLPSFCVFCPEKEYCSRRDRDKCKEPEKEAKK